MPPSKRIKINFDTINKGNFEPIDMSKVYEDQKKREIEDSKRYLAEVEAEKIRIGEIRCPFCGSKEKDHFVNRGTNGVLGSGHSSWLIEEYYICKGCGIHYSDLNKNEIQKPYKGFF
jgi:transposase-like protein